MRIAVLGSGIQGVFTAWWLAKSGYTVSVIDRCTSAALETSFANGGQISVSYAEPLANTKLLRKLIRAIICNDIPIKFKPCLDRYQWIWIMNFLIQCLPWNSVPNTIAMVRMAQYSRKLMKSMRQDLGIEYHSVDRGILNIYRNKDELEKSKKIINLMCDLGVDRRIISTKDLISIEPALAHNKNIVGGDYTPDDESGDAYLFTNELARKCANIGVEFFYGTLVNQLLLGSGGCIESVELIRPDGYYEILPFDSYVVALGCYSPFVLRPLGIPCNVYPVKGYSATFSIKNPDLAPTVSLIDSYNKLVLSRIGDNLRLASFLEISGYSRRLDDHQCKLLPKLASELFPSALNLENPKYWAGLRPATPSSIPLIGRTKIRNLYLNTGHGSLGWTMGAGSSKSLVDIMNGIAPEPEFPFIGL